MMSKRTGGANVLVERKFFHPPSLRAINFTCVNRIWEKKYGKNANHVKKRQETARGAKGKGLRPGNERSSKPHRSERPKEHQRPLPKRGEHTKVEQAKFDGQGTLSSGRRTERPLHPSWEAKRKQRSANILPAQGTKITFDS